MKKVLKIFIIILLIIILALSGLQLWIYIDHTKAKKRLVVVKSYVESFYGVDEDGLLYDVSFDNPKKVNGKDLKIGQEIEIYWHGTINYIAPAGIGGVRKYKILKEESDIKIPDYAMIHCYNTPKNVMAHIREISNEKIEFRILDTNEIPYEYDFGYSLYKKNIENEEYNNELIEENKKEREEKTTKKKNGVVTSTNTVEPYNPDTSKYKTVWERVNEKDVVSMDDVIKIVDSTQGHLDIKGMFDWTKVYGVLEQGEYQFVLKSKADNIHFNSIVFKFVIDENGVATCEPAEFRF